jgi:hypothetical protein
LAGGFDRLECREQDNLDRRVNLLQLIEDVDAGEARHPDVTNHGINQMRPGQLNRFGAAIGEENIVFVLE